MENLYERLDILEQAGLITPFVSEQAKKIVELITECGSPMDEEKMAMFTTHIAMAIQRILNGDVENPLEEAVLEELRKEEAYEKADEVAEKIYDRNLLGGLYRENPVKSRNYEAVKSSKKWENVGNSYIIPALLLYRYSYI